MMKVCLLFAVAFVAVANAQEQIKLVNARQDSVSWNGVPSRAIDGNRGTNYFNPGSCTHTGKNRVRTAMPYWEADVSGVGVALVKSVTITNRGDCCSGRLQKFKILIDGRECHNQVAAMGKGETRTFPCNKVGKVVRIQLQTTEFLTLCEVSIAAERVVACSPQAGLISQGKPATQSSIGWGGSPSRAVDGRRTTSYFANPRSCTHTTNQKSAWWQVDLQKPSKIDSVSITNRGDCCHTRLANFDIKVDGKVCASIDGAMGQGETKSYPCKAYGRRVRIQLRGKNYLTLCEVQVFGRQCGAGTGALLSQGKTASQSSIGWGGSPQRGVDGITSTNYFASPRSCTHTLSQTGAWWQVNLGGEYQVDVVTLVNRGDCCSGRLSNFQIKVDNLMCATEPKAVGSGATKPYTCNKIGRVVRVQLIGKNYLTLCEVKVDGRGFF